MSQQQSGPKTYHQMLEDFRKGPQTEEQCLDMVSRDGHILQYVKQQTHAIALAAVRQTGMALEYVQEQTPDICLAGVQNNGWALEFVREQSPEVCWAAVENTSMALQHVEHQTPELCLMAVSKFGQALKEVVKKTPDICLAAVNHMGRALEHVPERLRTPDICLTAVRNNGLSLNDVPNQTLDIILAALNDNSLALEYVALPMDSLALAASHQLADWLTVFSACDHIDNGCKEQLIYPFINAVPLGKSHHDEWAALTPAGEPLLHLLDRVVVELKDLDPNDTRIQKFDARVRRQVEWLMARANEQPADDQPMPMSMSKGADEPL